MVCFVGFGWGVEIWGVDGCSGASGIELALDWGVRAGSVEGVVGPAHPARCAGWMGRTLWYLG